jgi:hypothetical protein
MIPQQPTVNPAEGKGKYHDGRDEMNLADFPISALQRHQTSDADGRKRDRLEFEATRYDPVTHQRVLSSRHIFQAGIVRVKTVPRPG